MSSRRNGGHRVLRWRGDGQIGRRHVLFIAAMEAIEFFDGEEFSTWPEACDVLIAAMEAIEFFDGESAKWVMRRSPLVSPQWRPSSSSMARPKPSRSAPA